MFQNDPDQGPHRTTRSLDQSLWCVDPWPRYIFETNEINHKEKTKTWYFCPFCDYKASSSVSIKYHKQTVHEGVRFNCDLCDAFFTRKESLKTHIRSKHEGIKYPCDLCEYKATEKGALKKHKLSQHSLLNLQFPCQLCDFGAKTQKQHKLHMTIKHGISLTKFWGITCLKWPRIISVEI